jgi:glucokinase
MYLGIEIGGTKLQLGVGADDGKLHGLWRHAVDVAAGPEGIRRQIVAAVPELLAKAAIEHGEVRGVGIGFGGPVDDATHTVIKSHQIQGWDNSPLADWISEVVGLPAVLGNDCDVAGLAEALHGAGKGLSPIFYITIGSGIGGGFIINGEIYRGCGRGAAEIGHVRLSGVDALSCAEQVAWLRDLLTKYDVPDVLDNINQPQPLECLASGWTIGQRASFVFQKDLSALQVAEATRQGDEVAQIILEQSWVHLAEAICHVIALLCPRRIVIGGGVSLMGEKLLFEPLRRMVAARVFKPFAGLTDIVPAALGEEVVVHGAIALAHKRLG